MIYSSYSLYSMSFYCSLTHRNLHSFPTRRSSDLDPDGKVRYAFEFYILKPIDLSKGAHKVMYEPPNRGGSYIDRKSTRLNSSHRTISYAVFCLKKKKKDKEHGVIATKA